MPARVLILEDDDGIRSSLAFAMESEGYQPMPFASGEDALEEIRGGARPDLMLVDLILGGIDGFTFIRQARLHCDAPIIVVSARSDTHDIVDALEAGADDYVTKPYQITEVSARLRALQRRPAVVVSDGGSDGTGGAAVLDSRHGPLVLREAAGIVVRGSEQVHLTVTEFRLLCELAGSMGRVLSRRVLLERVWDQGYFGDERIVDVHIRRLRTKIEQQPGDPELLMTVRGLGYRFDPR